MPDDQIHKAHQLRQTKKTNEKIPNPNNAWEKTWRQMYRSIEAHREQWTF